MKYFSILVNVLNILGYWVKTDGQKLHFYPQLTVCKI